MIVNNIIHTSLKGNKPEEVPNQDFISIYDDEKLLVVSVSDGLGSSSNSHFGAKLACDVVIDYFTISDLDIDLISESLISIWKNKIRLLGGAEKDYRTTNSFIAVIKPENKIIAARLGDLMLSLKIDGLFRYFKSNQKDFLNETLCLGSGNNTKYQVAVYQYTYNYDFLIATDGFGDEVLEDKIQLIHSYFIDKYSKIKVEERNQVLEKEISEFVSEKNDDDKSLIFCWSNLIENERN